MRKARIHKRNRAITAAAGTAGGAILTIALMPSSANAGVDTSLSASQTFFNITTAGATALGNLNRQSGGQGQLTRLGNLAGNAGTNNLLINDTSYFNDSLNIGQQLNPGVPGGNQDYWKYQFHETGSIEGILELSDSYGLTVSGVVGPTNATGTNPWWTGNGGSLVTGTPYVNTRVQMAWSDVKTIQAFAKGLESNRLLTARPNTSGYGFGRGSVGSTNFQKYRSIESIVGTAADQTAGKSGQDLYRNETVAVVPFTVSANPGTGLETLTAEDVKWLNTTGRLKNGANFNALTRDGGSGTRNEGANNLGYDPSWGSGERDRVSQNPTPYNATAPDGSTVTVHLGDEAPPLANLLDGTATLSLNEDRVSTNIHFADKSSGGGRLRPTLIASRMAVGLLSATDVAGRGLTGATADANDQLRVLKINFDSDNNAAHFYQPKPDEVTTGQYKLWSQEQSVTVVPTDYTGTSDNRVRDDVDQSIRKFIDNIKNSSGIYPNTAVDATPADGILANGFILPDFMAVTKDFDGETQVQRARPKETEFQNWKASAVGQKLNWADPSALDGYTTTSGVFYDIYLSTNTLSSSHPHADISIQVTAKTALAGDFSQDGVRDKNDVNDLADSLAIPSTYLANKGFGTATGHIVHDTANVGTLDSSYHLLVLGDLNSDGSFDKKDARFFLYGASVDTTDAANADLTAAYGHSAATATAQERRSIGVRTGELKKNAAVQAYNDRLAALVSGGTITQGAADSLAVNKFDVNNDGIVNRADAQYVDRSVGKNITSLSDVLSTYDDLVSAELQDNKGITHIKTGVGSDGTGTSDMELIRVALGAALTDADANFDGVVNSLDFTAIATNFNASGHKWSEGDFDFNGVVNALDFNALATNYAAGPGPLPGALVFSSLVPEPTSMGVLLLAGFGAKRRRRF